MDLNLLAIILAISGHLIRLLSLWFTMLNLSSLLLPHPFFYVGESKNKGIVFINLSRQTCFLPANLAYMLIIFLEADCSCFSD